MPTTIFSGTVAANTSMPSSPISTGVSPFDMRGASVLGIRWTITAPSGYSGALGARIQVSIDDVSVSDANATWVNVDADFSKTPVASGTLSDSTAVDAIYYPGATRIRVFGFSNSDASHALTVAVNVWMMEGTR